MHAGYHQFRDIYIVVFDFTTKRCLGPAFLILPLAGPFERKSPLIDLTMPVMNYFARGSQFVSYLPRRGQSCVILVVWMRDESSLSPELPTCQIAIYVLDRP